MADKIVQLTDKNSNNLYPIAGAVHENAVSTGGLSASAVTTPKIANSAVTSDKIDWTTIDTGWVNCTYADNWKKSDRDWATPLQVRRVGKKCYLRGEVVPIGTQTFDQRSIGNLPTGFYPSSAINVPTAAEDNTYIRTSVGTNGSIQIGFQIQAQSQNDNVNMLRKRTYDKAWYSVVGAEWFID